jgi:hypothetical protein
MSRSPESTTLTGEHLVFEGLIALIVDEGKWFPAAIGTAALSVAILLWRQRARNLPVRVRVLASMNLAAGVTIGTMAFGHLLAVLTKLAVGTLREGSLPIFLGIGFVLALPSWLVVRHTGRIVAMDAVRSRTVVLNSWLAASLVVLGPPNLPLTVQALLTIAYDRHSRPAVGWVIAGVSVLWNAGLFVAAVLFMLSGQSFEQFSGIQ